MKDALTVGGVMRRTKRGMMDPEVLLRKFLYPLQAKIIKDNPYKLPIGKIFNAKRKEGNASPFAVEIQGDRIYQMAEDEVEIIK